jgi:hypothetical protein
MVDADDNENQKAYQIYGSLISTNVITCHEMIGTSFHIQEVQIVPKTVPSYLSVPLNSVTMSNHDLLCFPAMKQGLFLLVSKAEENTYLIELNIRKPLVAFIYQ